MNDKEFLDDVERRCINGDAFTPQETHRLWMLCGYFIPPHETRVVYMRGGGRKHVKIARRRLIEQGIKRLKGENAAIEQFWRAIDTSAFK